MKALGSAIVLAALFTSGCQEENTYVTSPEDWQPPNLSWLSPPNAEVRGRIGVDVAVYDGSQITRVTLYVDGIEDQTVGASPYRFEIVTDSLDDGIHLLEARAWDEFSNMGVSPILRMRVANQPLPGPRLLWVPDDYPLIQAAINAAQDYDTIRVRDGMYYETLNLFGKGIWIESEHGPLRCTVDNAGANNAFLIVANYVPCVIRGFRMEGAGYLISMREGAQASFYNNVVISDSADGVVFALNCGGDIINNLFIGSRAGVQIGYMWGHFYNNILRDVTDVAFWNMSLLRNPLVYGYDLFWNNFINYNDRFAPGIGDLEADPMLDMSNGRPMPGSPVIDAGNPDIIDLDNSRSDIGPFGGVWAY